MMMALSNQRLKSCQNSYVTRTCILSLNFTSNLILLLVASCKFFSHINVVPYQIIYIKVPQKLARLICSSASSKGYEMITFKWSLCSPYLERMATPVAKLSSSNLEDLRTDSIACDSSSKILKTVSPL